MSTEDKKPTNFFDVLIAIMNFILNLLKLDKVICLLVIYILVRDFVFVRRLSSKTDISSMLIDAKIIEHIIENDNTLIVVLGAIIVVLVAVILILIFLVIPIYKREIDRISSVRSNLMHDGNGLSQIDKHHSSIIT